ncbi:MAG: LuxR family transcriptional regulator [Gammaproteobacteria bacterium]|nr:LuxR family transcriptional regulator [Gammaproteobacteria bacterium]
MTKKISGNSKVVNIGKTLDLIMSGPNYRQKIACFLGDNFPGVYFTPREAACMMRLLQGKSMRGIAEELNLSPRTVEFYTENMRGKLSCKSKFELIDFVKKSDFLQNYKSKDTD